MKITKNTSDVPSEVIRKLCVLLAPSGVTSYRVKVMAAPNSYGAHGHAKVLSNATTLKMPGVDRRYIAKGRAGQGYLSGYAIGSRAETIIFLIAHELRHLWQAQHARGWRVRGSRGQYSERDADAYALNALRRFRRGEIAGLAEQATLIPPGVPYSVHKAKCDAAWKKLEAKRDAILNGPLRDAPPAIRNAAPEGSSYDGWNLVAPSGYVWKATSTHAISCDKTDRESVKHALQDIWDGIEKCEIEDCETCAPAPVVIATPARAKPVKPERPAFIFKGPEPIAIAASHPARRKWLTRAR